jgi:hypothetical protein
MAYAVSEIVEKANRLVKLYGSRSSTAILKISGAPIRS